MPKTRYGRTGFLAAICALVAGAAGLLCGYFGNFWLAQNPGTMAPVTGIFITGPAGAVIGFLYGAYCGISDWSSKRVAAGAAVVVAVVALGSLFLAAPSYMPHAQLVQGSVVGCASPFDVLNARTAHWRSESERVVREHLVDVRPGWQNEIQQMVTARPGALLTINIERVAWLEQRAWKTGRIDHRLTSQTSEPRTEQVFLDNFSCSAPLPSTRQFCLCFERSSVFPPSNLPEFLGVWVAHPIPLAIASSRKDLVSWASSACPN